MLSLSSDSVIVFFPLLLSTIDPRAPVPDRAARVIPRTFLLALPRTQVPVAPIVLPADLVARAGPETPPEPRSLPSSSPGPVRLLTRTSPACAGGRRRDSAVYRNSLLCWGTSSSSSDPFRWTKILGPPLPSSSLLSQFSFFCPITPKLVSCTLENLIFFQKSVLSFSSR